MKIDIDELKISIIIPLYNEEKTIIQLLEKIKYVLKNNYEIIIVDDGSTDNSLSLVRAYKRSNEKLKILYHEKNLGKGAAIKTAKNVISGRIVIIQDADLEYDPNDYLKLVKPIREKKNKVVYGSRVSKNGRYNNKNFTSIFRIIGNHILTAISNFFNKQKLTDAHTCYKVFDKDLFDKIILEEDGFSFCPEITTKISKLGVEIIEIPIAYNGRNYKDGKKIKFTDAIYALITILKYKYFK